jgi:hypothetical protein
MIQRFLELERRMAHLERRLGQIDSKSTQAAQSVAQVWGSPGGGGGTAGGPAGFECLSIPAIGAGGSATADVYQMVRGTSVLFATGATIWNPYLSATTAGRICTLAQNSDGSFMILGQSCT